MNQILPSINPFVRLNDQLSENYANGLLPPVPRFPTENDATHALSVTLSHSVDLGIISHEEYHILLMESLQSSPEQMLTAHRCILVVNALVQGNDMHVDQAQGFIPNLCAIDARLTLPVIAAFLKDLQTVNTRLLELAESGKITPEVRDEIALMRVATDRVSALLKVSKK